MRWEKSVISRREDAQKQRRSFPFLTPAPSESAHAHNQRIFHLNEKVASCETWLVFSDQQTRNYQMMHTIMRRTKAAFAHTSNDS